MGRAFLRFYVAIGILICVFSIVMTLTSGSAYHVLSDTDWMIFIIACGALSISEALEGRK